MRVHERGGVGALLDMQTCGSRVKKSSVGMEFVLYMTLKSQCITLLGGN
jgi:hypothetical protein